MTAPARQAVTKRPRPTWKIPASLAADYSVEITEGVAHSMLKSQVPQGIFCIQFVPTVDSAFTSKYPDLGAHATK